MKTIVVKTQEELDKLLEKINTALQKFYHLDENKLVSKYEDFCREKNETHAHRLCRNNNY